MPTRRGKEQPAEKPGRKKFIPTCGNCDDGWLHYIFKTTEWYDGKRHSERLYGPSDVPKPVGEMPPNSDQKDHKIRYYSAVSRCRCMGEQAVIQKEKAVPMPKEIKGGMRRLGLDEDFMDG